MYEEMIIRPRRLRGNPTLREMVRETSLSPADLVYPIFVVPGCGLKQPISSLDGQCRLSPDEAAKLVLELRGMGLKAVILFGIPEKKDPEGTPGSDPEGPVQLAIKAIKKAAPEILVITDVCLCEYTDHGHCGLVENDGVANDPTLPHLARQALSHAHAGADMVAPSDMMDGRVEAIRSVLDYNHFTKVPIMAYSVKYSSAFYGPFREAAGSCPQFGDRKSYQMDPSRRREALLEVDLDLAEGADIVMIKPAGLYLDIIREVRNHCQSPVAAYQVSGEYAMLMAAVRAGLLDEKAAALESLIAIKRAGADMILTYLTPKVLRWLGE